MIESWLWPHLVTYHAAVPLLIEHKGGLIVEVTEGETIEYRGQYFFDLASIALKRMVHSLAEELAMHCRGRRTPRPGIGARVRARGGRARPPDRGPRNGRTRWRRVHRAAQRAQPSRAGDRHEISPARPWSTVRRSSTRAAFFDGRFHGLADFIVRASRPMASCGTSRPTPSSPATPGSRRCSSWRPTGSRSSSHGVPAPREVHLWLGDGSRSHHRYADLRPILSDRTARLHELLDEPLAVPEWGDPRPPLRAAGATDCRAAAEAQPRRAAGGGRAGRPAQATGRRPASPPSRSWPRPPRRPTGIKAPVFEQDPRPGLAPGRPDASRVDDRPDRHRVRGAGRPAASRCIPAPEPGRRVLRLRGRPAVRRATAGPIWGLEYLFGASSDGADRRGRVPRLSGPTTARPRSARRSRLHRLARALAGSARVRACTSTTTRPTRSPRC